MNGVRYVLATDNIPQAYWPYEVRGIAFKETLLVHSTSGVKSLSAWNGCRVKFPEIFSFGQLGCMPKLPQYGKITYHSSMGRYMGMRDMRDVTIHVPNGQNIRCRAADFLPVQAATHH